MANIIEELNSKSNLLTNSGVSEEEIQKAEETLNLKFAEEYKIFLKQYRIVAYCGHELTGLVNSKRTGVVQVTLNEWNLNPSLPRDMYVVEKTGVEGVIIWQRCDGKIVYTDVFGKITEYCDSLADYVRKY